jgi:hypothetical protein
MTCMTQRRALCFVLVRVLTNLASCWITSYLAVPFKHHRVAKFFLLASIQTWSDASTFYNMSDRTGPCTFFLFDLRQAFE